MPSQFPHFIQKHLIHSSDLNLSRKNRTKLALLENLHLYELQNKQVLNFIDLQNTVLNKVKLELKSIVPVLNEIQDQTDVLSASNTCSSDSVGSITLGKYIYQLRNDKKVYIIIKCCESMVVIIRDLEGFALQAEYEGVHSFKICKSKDYKVKLAVSFVNSNPDVVTNFQEFQDQSVAFPKAVTNNQALDRIKMKQSELLVHKTITKKEFAKLKSTELFGCNFLRTTQFEEMQVLSKRGDAWYKVTSDDDIVIGVPLVNNSSSRLTVLRNMRAVLSGSKELSYKFTMYQLGTRLNSMESIQGFFQSQDDDNNKYYTWGECSNFSLRPEAFCVLIIQLKIGEHIPGVNGMLPLFVFYDVVISRRSFTQKCFLTALSIQGIFSNELCRLNFHENHLHRDLLAVMSTCYNKEVVFEFHGNVEIFEDYICTKLGFIRVSNRRSCPEEMHIDGQDESDDDIQSNRIFFYNKDPGSLWHGTLLAITYNSDHFCDADIYTKTQEKSLVFTRLLNVELRLKCVIKEIRYRTRSLSEKLTQFEEVLRDECCSHLEMCSSSLIKKSQNIDVCKKKILQRDLHLNELKTDKLFNDLHL